jgi:hypothetical protein
MQSEETICWRLVIRSSHVGCHVHIGSRSTLFNCNKPGGATREKRLEFVITNLVPVLCLFVNIWRVVSRKIHGIFSNMPFHGCSNSFGSVLKSEKSCCCDFIYIAVNFA